MDFRGKGRFKVKQIGVELWLCFLAEAECLTPLAIKIKYFLLFHFKHEK